MSAADDRFSSDARGLESRVAAHEETRATKRYADAEKHLDRLVQDFVMGLQASWLAFTRFPESEGWLLQRSTDDLLESVVALPALSREGMTNVARRELRYLLEAAVKYVYVDQQVEAATALEDRVQFLGDEVPRSSIKPVDDLTLRMVDPVRFRGAVKSSFGALSGYVHPSRRALEEGLRRATRGEFIGFEGASVREDFNALAATTLDLVLVLVFEGIGPSFTGDLFIRCFDARGDWKFHRTKFVPEVSRSFDYKAERQSQS